MARLRVGVLISGRGSNLQALIDAAADAAYPAEIALVLSNRPGAPGLDRAAEAGIAHDVVDHRSFDGREAFETALTERMEAAGVELVAHAGFMRLLTGSYCERWRDRAINIHPSLLPAFPGLHVHEQVLAAGVRISGCTVHFVREAMDAGPIIAQAAVPVLPDDDPDSLAARVLVVEHRVYPLAVRLIAEGRVKVVDERVRLDGVAADGAALFSPPVPAC